MSDHDPASLVETFPSRGRQVVELFLNWNSQCVSDLALSHLKLALSQAFNTFSNYCTLHDPHTVLCFYVYIEF